MAYRTLATELERGILTVRLNRPERLNALTAEMLGEFLALLDEVDRDDAIRVVIVTGEGRADLPPFFPWWKERRFEG
jgi:enoyl-CoA hydratase/carnithine racemase